MAWRERIRTYTYIGIAVGTFLLAVGMGVNLLTEPEPTRGDVSAFVTLVAACLLGISLLWNQYKQRPRSDPKYWRQRAQETRAHAERMTDPASQRLLLEMTNDYEELAKRAEERLLSSKQPE
jgi:hypothetical protein